MKKLLIGLSFVICHLSFSVALTSCAGEEDDIFSASAAERLNESSAKYSARLEAQPNGWAMQYYPTYSDEYPYGSGYLLLMDFNPDYSVRVAMNNRFSGNVYKNDVSAWEVIKEMDQCCRSTLSTSACTPSPTQKTFLGRRTTSRAKAVAATMSLLSSMLPKMLPT